MDIYEKVLLIILPVLITAFFASLVPRKLKERNRFIDAAATFRGKVLAELEGIYPVTQGWQPEVYPRFSQSITKVEIAAAEFSHFVKRKTDFDIAVKKYHDYCNKVTFAGVAAWYMYPSMRKPDDTGPVEEFKAVIEHLFSFAKYK